MSLSSLAPSTSTTFSRSFQADCAAERTSSKDLPVTSRSRFLRACAWLMKDVATRSSTVLSDEVSNVANRALARLPAAVPTALGRRSNVPEMNMRERPAESPLPPSTQPESVPLAAS
ncbi:hypothetical protein D3C74_289070 [compost metagenome]